MRLINNTSIRSEILRKVINFARPPGISNFAIEVIENTNIGSYLGSKATNRTYWNENGRVTRSNLGGNLWIGPGTFVYWNIAYRYPYRKPGGRGGYLPAILRTPTEQLVYTVAHELRHLWQFNHKRGSMVWGSRRSKWGTSERDADAYAIHKTRLFRAMAGEHERTLAAEDFGIWSGGMT